MQAVCVGSRVVMLRRQEDVDLDSDGFLDSSGKIMDCQEHSQPLASFILQAVKELFISPSSPSSTTVTRSLITGLGRRKEDKNLFEGYATLKTVLTVVS